MGELNETAASGRTANPAGARVGTRGVDFRTLLFGRIETSVIIGTALMVLLFVIGTHGLWLYSIPSVLRITTQVGIVAIGQAMLMASGEIDLSVGAVFGFVGVVFISLMSMFAIGPVPAALLALAVGGGIGALNGIITVRFKVPSMIVTLGGMFVFRALDYVATQGFSLSIPHDYRHVAVIEFFRARLWGINVTFLFLLILTAFFVFVLARTRLGNHILAVGGDANAALANGIPPGWTKIKAFMICSAMAGLAGILVTVQEGSVYSTSGLQMELDTIAAAVIGGCTLRGGLGSVWGTVLGVFLLSSLKGGLLMIGAPTSWYIALVGLILIAFLVSSKLLNDRMGVMG